MSGPQKQATVAFKDGPAVILHAGQWNGNGGRPNKGGDDVGKPESAAQRWRTNAAVKQEPPSTTDGAAAGQPPATPRYRLKTVAIFLAGTRRLSQQAHEGRQVYETAAQRRLRKMEEAAGKLTPRQLDYLKKNTHFNQKELESLSVIFRRLVNHSNATTRAMNSNAIMPKTYSNMDGIDTNCFCELMHTTFDILLEEFLMERIFMAWVARHDRQPLRVEPFLVGLSVFLRGTRSERIAFAFRVYDLNSDGYISREEMFVLMKNTMIHQASEEDPDAAIREWLDIMLRKIDKDTDGKISFEDFSKAVTEDYLLLEAFGPCFPSRHSVVSFISTLV